MTDKQPSCVLYGIIGTGMIARVHAEALRASSNS